jgi:hypothetical protein
MKTLHRLIPLAMVGLGVLFQAVSAYGITITYAILANIDGQDLLDLQGGTVQWDHLSYAEVGRTAGQNLPTVINGSDWYPTWPAPPPNEINYPALSSVGPLTPALPDQNMTVTLDPILARDSLTIYQLPTSANDYTLILDFNDDASPGAAWYEADVTVTTVPDGGLTLALLGTAMTGLAFVRRKR